MLDLLKKLAHATRDEAMAVLQYVLAENEIMRSKIDGRVPVDEADRKALNRLGRQVPKRFDEVFTVARASTVRRWHRPRKPSKKRTGRPMKAAELCALIIRLAEENPGWGVGTTL